MFLVSCLISGEEKKISNNKLAENNKPTSNNQNKHILFFAMQALKAEIMVKW